MTRWKENERPSKYKGNIEVGRVIYIPREGGNNSFKKGGGIKYAFCTSICRPLL
jgi:hypothetical protein